MRGAHVNTRRNGWKTAETRDSTSGNQLGRSAHALPGFALSRASRSHPHGWSAYCLLWNPSPTPPPSRGAVPLSCSLGAAAGGAVVRRRRLRRTLARGRRSFRLPGRPCAAPARSVTFPSRWLCGWGLPEPLVLRRGECGARGPGLGAGQPRPRGAGRWPGPDVPAEGAGSEQDPPQTHPPGPAPTLRPGPAPARSPPSPPPSPVGASWAARPPKLEAAAGG